MTLTINRKPNQGFSMKVGDEQVRILFKGYTEREGAKISIFAPDDVEILRDELKHDPKKRADFLNRKSSYASFNK